MLDFNTDIKKSINATLTELKKQKERYIDRIDKLMVSIQEIESMQKKIHDYDALIKEITATSKTLRETDKENKKILESSKQQMSSIEQKIKQMKSAVAQQEQIISTSKEVTKSIQKLKTTKEELAAEFEDLSDQWNAMKKSNLYKTLKLLNSDDDEFFQKIAEYIVNNVVARQSGVFGGKTLSLEIVENE